jgi:diphthine synthase
MFYLIGLGLGDEKDISLKGLEAIKSSSKVYLEHYTSLLGVDPERLSTLYGKEVILADREMVESDADCLFVNAKSENVSFLVVGDPFGATTHTDIVLRAKSEGIKVQIIHNASIMNAIGCIGLALYSYGVSVSIVFFTETWKPDSWYSKVKDNRERGLHTLCLLGTFICCST